MSTDSTTIILVIILIIWLTLFIYIFQIDRKLKNTEIKLKQLMDKDED